MTGKTQTTYRNPNEQAHYTANGFNRHFLHPSLKEKTEEELALGFALFGAELGIGFDLPVPPSGLPGVWHRKVDLEVMDLIRIGASYAVAMANGEKRTLWNLYSEMQVAITKAYVEGRKQAEQEYCDLERQRADEARQKAKASQVYFIQSGSGPIKIGIASDVEKRRRSLQTAHPFPLTLLATCGGGAKQERAYHKQFASHRQEGEWFTPHPDILAEIERLNTDDRSVHV